MPKVGFQNPQAKDGGTWKTWSKFWAKHSGSWKRPISVFVKSGGSWVEVYDEAPIISNYSVNAQYIGGYWYNYKTFNLESNGFATTISSSDASDLYPSSLVADSSVTVSATKISSIRFDFPTVTVTNSSGTSTV